MACNMCKQDKKTSLQPTRRTLLFGPVISHGNMFFAQEQRCSECEKKVTRWVDRMIREKFGD
jgi:hypothetical protein